MKNFFIIHGSGDNSNEHWLPWLKKNIEEKGYECIAPDFPCENGHILSKWYEVMEKYEEKVTSETVFVAHSRGASFVLNYLMDFNKSINSLYIVSGFVEYYWYPKENGEIDTFFARDFDFEKIKKLCPKIVNIQSDNDSYLTIEQGKKVTACLGGEYLLVKGGGHFTSTTGYTEFSLLLNTIFQNS